MMRWTMVAEVLLVPLLMVMMVVMVTAMLLYWIELLVALSMNRVCILGGIALVDVGKLKMQKLTRQVMLLTPNWLMFLPLYHRAYLPKTVGLLLSMPCSF